MKKGNKKKKMNLKQLYKRFRLWQIKPFDYKNDSEGKTRCANCGTMCSDNYCPRCGQSTDTKRITWQSVGESIMVVWGMDSRSLPNSVLQLLFRPGQFIDDYISGKRLISFPPVNMLVVVAILSYFVDQIAPKNTQDLGEGLELMSEYLNWAQDNVAWATLLTNSMLIIPTWVVYRFSPRHNRHTLPEGFFVQVFVSSLMLIIGYIAQLTYPLLNFVVNIYYYFIYKQLFGYGWWGNLWRVFLCLYDGFMISIFIYVGIVYSYRMNSIYGIYFVAFFIFLIILPTAIASYIGWYQEKKKKKARITPPLPQTDSLN